MKLHNATAMRLLEAWLVPFSHSATLLSRPFPFDIPWAHFGQGFFCALSGAPVRGSARRSHGAIDFGIRHIRRLHPTYLTCSFGSILLVWPLCSVLPLSHTLRSDRWPAAWASLVIHGAQWNRPATFTTQAFPSTIGIDILPSMIFLIDVRPLFPGHRLPDWSYGFYLWSWPVRQIGIHFRPDLTVPEPAVLATRSTLPLTATSWLRVGKPFLPLTREPHTIAAPTEARP